MDRAQHLKLSGPQNKRGTEEDRTNQPETDVISPNIDRNMQLPVKRTTCNAQTQPHPRHKIDRVNFNGMGERGVENIYTPTPLSEIKTTRHPTPTPRRSSASCRQRAVLYNVRYCRISC